MKSLLFLLFTLTLFSFALGRRYFPDDEVDREQLSAPTFTSQFTRPSVPLTRNAREETLSEIRRKISWIQLTPDGKQERFTPRLGAVERMRNRGRNRVNGEDPLPTQSQLDSPSFNHDPSGDLSGEEPNNATAERYIFSPDSRWQANTYAYPNSVAGLLTFSGGFCTATLVGPRTILTAGHCVHQGNGGSWYSDWKFYPGQNSAPTSTTPYYGWSYVNTVTGWTVNGDFNYDYALITLSTTNTYRGWMSFGWNDNIAAGWTMNVNGYPSDKSYGTQWHTDGQLWEVTSTVLRDQQLDIIPGNSGSGTYAYWSSTNTRTIYGIVSAQVWEQRWSWGCFCTVTYYYNQHTRITSDRFQQICSWINDPSVC